MDVNVEKFPIVFRERLENRDVLLPKDIEIEYEPQKAYRCVYRDIGDAHIVHREDMMSYADLGKRPPKTLPGGIYNPEYYSTSFFVSLDMLKNKMAFPHPRKKAIVGYVHSAGGPCLRNELTSHLSWWMYEDADISNFEFLEENDE